MLESSYPWLRDLAGCPQNPVHHAEGDVLIHTRMVAEALIADPAWIAADPVTRSVLFAAALLHDVAKPASTRVEAGLIVSPRHALLGARMAQDLLYQRWASEDPVPFAIRRQIVGLVRHHGLPLWLLEKADPLRVAIRAGLAVSNRLTAQIALADVRGRICQDEKDLLDRVALFEEYCREQSCFESPYPFASAHSRYLYFAQERSAQPYQAYDATKFEVTLLAGLPGAGKDHWVAQQGADLPVISLDALRIGMGVSPEEPQGAVINAARDQARDYLRRQQPFIWNATNVSRQLRAGLIGMCSDYGARVRLVYIEAPWPTLLRQNMQREARVPERVLQRLAEKLEVPEPFEAHRVEYIAG